MSEELQSVKATLASATDLRAMSHVLGAVRNLLHGEGLTNLETRPLLMLMGALVDHADGKPHPFLAVAGNGGNSTHAADAEFKGCTAAVVALIRRSGTSKDAAEKTVSEYLKGNGVDLPPSTIKTWCDEIRNKRIARAVIEAFTAYSKALPENPGEIDVRAALETLPTLLRTRV